MSELIPFCNDWAVGLFGSVLAAYFCSALTTRRNKWIFWVSMTLIPVAQSWVYYLWDGSFLRKIYPLLVHLPLFLVLLFLTRRALWPLISIFTAYLCCQLRRWIALFVIQLLGGGELMRCSVELLVTLPLLLVLLKWAAPTIAYLGSYPPKIQCLFGSVPVMYYAFDYLTRIYSDILIRGEPVAVEFMPFLCCVAYLVFLLHYSKVERDKIQAEQVQNNMSMQLAQAEKLPPYLVFGDKTLVDMCAKAPRRLEDMKEIYGMGERKYAKYGQKFFAEIEAYRQDHPTADLGPQP